MMRRSAVVISVLGGLFVAAAALRLLATDGGLEVPGSGVVWDLRGKRLAAAAAVGACLGLAGLSLQSLLKNPLASPDLMGLSPGAGLAVTIAAYLNFRAGQGLVLWSGYEGPALIGAVAALGLVYLLSQRRGVIEPVSMILIGVIVGLVLGAGTVFVQQLMPDRGQSSARWLLGSLSDNSPWSRVALVGGVAVMSGVILWALGPAMDAAATSDDEARSMGVRLGPLRTIQFVLAGVLAAGSVTLAGPIGFVGLIAPHAARMLLGPTHRSLAIAAPIFGAVLMVCADAAVKVIDLPTGDPPIGVLTAALGGPFFIVLLRKQRAGRLG